MNSITEAEQYLCHYSAIISSIKHAAFMIERLKWKTSPQQLKASMSDITGRRSTSIVDTQAQMEELIKWQNIHRVNSQEIAHIKEILSDISADPESALYGKALTMWYVNKMDKIDIAVALGYETRKSAYDIHKKAMKKLAVALYGVYALKP